MTHSDLLEIGDEVVIKVDPECRAWTNIYNSVPDGTWGIVCGFTNAIIYEPRVQAYRQPGAYWCRGSVSVLLADGRVIPGDYSLFMVDQAEEQRRNTARRDASGALSTRQVRLGDLPNTKFWEQDKVRVRFPRNGSVHDMTVARISYRDLHNTRDDGSPWPFYDLEYPDGAQTSAEESWIELVERGNVWKYYHGEPLSFEDLAAEAGFFKLIGQATEVRNPKDDLYSWSLDEVLEAIKSGSVHGFCASDRIFGSGVNITAIRFNDERLGKRIAEETLKGFDLLSV